MNNLKCTFLAWFAQVKKVWSLAVRARKVAILHRLLILHPAYAPRPVRIIFTKTKSEKKNFTRIIENE